MKKLLQVPVFIFLFLGMSAQLNDLLVKNSSRGMFLEHTVAPKEGLYGIGRLYNVHPKHLAAYNQMDMNKGLSIGQVVNIPLSDTNFIQSGMKGVPLYYMAGDKENLTSVSSKNNKVQLDKLQSWNNLSGEQVPAGTKLVIGFLVSVEMADRVVTLQEKKKPVQVVEEKKPETTESKKPEPVVKKEEPKKTQPEVKKEEPVQVKEEPKQQQTPRALAEEKYLVDKYGYFTKHFNQQVKSSPAIHNQTVTSSIFKTVSGWADSKYYLLINGVEPGTIVKITNPSNDKVVYAKVLYSMEKIRQNQGVEMRISDATASFLSIYETDKFILKVNY